MLDIFGHGGIRQLLDIPNAVWENSVTDGLLQKAAITAVLMDTTTNQLTKSTAFITDWRESDILCGLNGNKTTGIPGNPPPIQWSTLTVIFQKYIDDYDGNTYYTLWKTPDGAESEAQFYFSSTNHSVYKSGAWVKVTYNSGGYAKPIKLPENGFFYKYSPAFTGTQMAIITLPHGLLINRPADLDAGAYNGMLYFATDNQQLYFYKDGAWIQVLAPQTVIISLPVGSMIMWPEVYDDGDADEPVAGYLRCGSTSSVDGNPYRYYNKNIYTELLTVVGSKYDDADSNEYNPDTSIYHALPTQENMIIRATSVAGLQVKYNKELHTYD